MEQWEELMKATNKAYETNCYYTALELCQRALRQAVRCFEGQLDPDSDQLLSAVMVSHFNLADTYIALDQVIQAAEIFEDASIYLQGLLADQQLGELQKCAVLRAGNCLHTEWNRFFHKYHAELPHEMQPRSNGLHLH